MPREAIRIVHTADVHLDAAFKLSGRKGDRKRQAIRNTFKRIVNDCLEWPAHVFIIAGDLFEEERVARDTMGFLAREFERLAAKNVPVLIAPGNHDPFTAGGRYAVTAWPKNVHVFTRASSDVLNFPALNLAVYGVAHTSTHTEGRLAQAVKAVKKGAETAVLVAHASDESASYTGKEAGDVWLPFKRDELAALGHDYAALGHFHRAGTIEHGGRVVAAYSGAPEGLNFGETGKRQYLRVTLGADGAHVEPRGVSEIDFLAFDVACDSFRTREEFFDAVAKLVQKNAGEVIALVNAKGRVSPGFEISGDLPDDVRGRFFEIDVRDETVPAYDWEALEKEETVRGEVARRFAAEMKAAGEASRAVLEKARLYAMDALEGRKIELPSEVLRVD